MKFPVKSVIPLQYCTGYRTYGNGLIERKTVKKKSLSQDITYLPCQEDIVFEATCRFVYIQGIRTDVNSYGKRTNEWIGCDGMAMVKIPPPSCLHPLSVLPPVLLPLGFHVLVSTWFQAHVLNDEKCRNFSKVIHCQLHRFSVVGW